MNPSTLERALFAWPEWRDSIHCVRSQFQYRFLPEGDELAKWQWDHNNEVYSRGISELENLGLPKSLIYYWLACFYAPYERPDGNADFDLIRDVFFTHGKFGDKLYPQAFTLVAPSEVPRYRQEIGQPPHRLELRGTPFRLEGTLELAAGDMLKEVVGAIRRARDDKALDHPLHGLVNRAKGRPQMRKHVALHKYRADEASFEELLSEEWQYGDTQAELQQLRRQYQNNHVRADKAERELQRKIFNRVYNWLHSVGIKPPRLKHKGQWTNRE